MVPRLPVLQLLDAAGVVVVVAGGLGLVLEPPQAANTMAAMAAEPQETR
jgi:hypothetical protein